MHPPLKFRLAALALAVALAGCASLLGQKLALRPQVPGDPQALAAAVESFYRATSPDGLVAAVEAAREAGPSSGGYHEIAAELARLQMRQRDEVEHLLAALGDPGWDGAALHLERAEDLPRDRAQQQRWLALLGALMQDHPLHPVRAHAAWLLAHHLHAKGDDRGKRRAVERLGAVLPLAVVGGWDNDQGKGFDQALPPEEGVDLGARYEGALMEIGWELSPPRDPRGAVELREYLAPDKWAVAYGAAAFHLPRAGRYELRVSSADPVKVFVNGALVLEAREVEDAWAFDQFVIPLDLPEGEHQVLLKSAHRTGTWRIFARLTGPAGGQVEVAPGRPGKVSSAQEAAPLAEPQVLAARLEGLEAGSALAAARRVEWARRLFGGTPAVRAAQEAVRAHPGVVNRFALMAALWNNNERGRTADLLSALDLEVGEQLPHVRRQQARFWQQEGLAARARKTLTQLVEAHPDRAPAARQLAQLFAEEKWLEDECTVLERLDLALPDTPGLRSDLAECWQREHRGDKAIAVYRELLRARPRDVWLLSRLHHSLRERGRLKEAVEVGAQMVAAHPERLWPRLRLSETLRRAGREEEAKAVLALAKEAFPQSAEVRRAQAALAWRTGDGALAVAAWQAALVRSPEDEAVANRLDYLAPAATGAWAADVPDEAAMEALLRARKGLVPLSGANLAWHLDHEVVQLRSDGSTINVTTQVVTALNQAGLDKLTRRRLQHAGRHRVLAAYAVDAAGRRSLASVRAKEVLFRGLEVGSTVVLQYRADAPPSGFLPRYLNRAWLFQSPAEQRSLAEFILWYPAGSALAEHRVGELEREERRVGEELRVVWRRRQVPPLLPEPHMPAVVEVASHVQISTVPGWDVYQKWEEALLEGAFGDSPELEALAARLVEGADTPLEKLLRIHQYVVEEIRYQQDYQSFIAGVKPHPATMVVERRYGDCKDKTVLFMTLAKRVGLEAHFATVRTRDRGQVLRGLPTQQFNHAIVYVPPQPGLPEGRFFDSTADGLDLEVLRDDNPGTEALVYDPSLRRFGWVPIPWQSPSHHLQLTGISYALSADGSARGELVSTNRGTMGAQVRRMARNPEQFKQFLQMVVGGYFAGASVGETQAVEVSDLQKPSEIRARFFAPAVARAEGEQLRLRLPTQWSPKGWFSLAERRHPLVLGPPHEMAWRFRIELPEGMVPARLPKGGEVSTPCLTFRREVRSVLGAVEVDQLLQVTCERVSPGEYPAYRARMEELTRLLDEELVVEQRRVRAVKPAGLQKKR